MHCGGKIKKKLIWHVQSEAYRPLFITGYCWCVDEDSGKPIPGTSVKDQVPKCDAIAAPMRPMNGKNCDLI